MQRCKAGIIMIIIMVADGGTREMKLFFIHGSGCVKEGWYFQTKNFPSAEAIDLPGHPKGKPCNSIEEYADWLSGQEMEKIGE